MSTTGKLRIDSILLYKYFYSENQAHYDDPRGLSDAVVAIQKLLQVIQDSKGEIAAFACMSRLDLIISTAGTVSRLRDEIKSASEELIAAEKSAVSVSSGSELFLRFITLTSLEQTVTTIIIVKKLNCIFAQDFEECKRLLVKRGMCVVLQSFCFIVIFLRECFSAEYFRSKRQNR